MDIFLFLLLIIVIGLSAVKATRLIRSGQARHPLFLDILTIAISQIVLSQIALGMSRLLTPWNLLILNAASALG